MRMFTLGSLFILAMSIDLAAQDSNGSPKAGEAMTVDLSGYVKLDLVWIPSGIFLMSSQETEVGRGTNEGSQHQVIHRKGFRMVLLEQ